MESELAPLRMDADTPSEMLIKKTQKEDVRVFKTADDALQRQASMLFDPESRPLPMLNQLTPTTSYQLEKPDSFIDDMDYDRELWFHIDQNKPRIPAISEVANDPYASLITQVNQLQSDLCQKEKTVYLDERGIDEGILVQSLPKNLHLVPNPKKGQSKKDTIVLSFCGNMMLSWDNASITIIKALEQGKSSNRSVTLELRRILEQDLEVLKEALAKNEVRSAEELRRDMTILYPQCHTMCMTAASSTITKIEKFLSITGQKSTEQIYHVAFTSDSSRLIIITSLCVLVYSLKEFKVECFYVYPGDHFPSKQDQFRWYESTSIHKREYSGPTSIQSRSTDDVYFQIGSKMHQLDYQMRPYETLSQLWSYQVKIVDAPQKSEKNAGISTETLKFSVPLTPQDFVQIYEMKGQLYDQSDTFYNTTFIFLDGLKPDPKEAQSQIFSFDLRQAGIVHKKDFCLACIDSRQLSDKENKLLVFESVSKQFLRLSLADHARFAADPLVLSFQHLSPRDLPDPTALTTSADLKILFIDYAGEHWKVFALDPTNMLNYREVTCSTSISPSRQNLLAPDLSYVLSVFNQRYSIFPLDLPVDMRTSSVTMMKDFEKATNFNSISTFGQHGAIMFMNETIAISTPLQKKNWVELYCFHILYGILFDEHKRAIQSSSLAYTFIQRQSCPENPDIVRAIYAGSHAGRGTKIIRPIVFTIDCKAAKVIKSDCKTNVEDFITGNFSSQGKAAIFECKSGHKLNWFDQPELVDVKDICPEGSKVLLLDNLKLIVVGYLDQDKAILRVKIYSVEVKHVPVVLGELEHPNSLKGDLRGCKYSKNESTVVFFSESCFCVVDIARFLESCRKEETVKAPDGQSRVQCVASFHEQSLVLNHNSFELSADGNWLAVTRRMDQEAFLIDKRCKYSLYLSSPGDPQSRVTFSFEAHGRVIVFNTKSNQVEFFELPSPEHPHLVTFIGAMNLPRGFDALHIRKEFDSLIVAGSSILVPKDLVTLRINLSRRNLGIGPCRSILMRYITADSQENRLNFAAALLRAFEMISPVYLQYWSVFPCLMYLLNHPGLVDSALAEMRLETLMLRHPLITLFYKFPKKESQRSILKLFEIVRTRSKRYPRISSSEFTNLLKDDDPRLLTKGLGAELLTRILCARIDVEPISSELISDSSTVIPYKTPFGKYLAGKKGNSGIANLGKALETANQRGLGKNGTKFAQSRTKRERVKEAIRPLLEDPPQNFSDYIPVQNLVPLDLRFGSDFSLLFFRTIETLDNHRLQKYLGGFIYYKWNQIYPAAVTYAALFWTQYVFVYIHLGYYLEQSWQTILLIVVAAVFLLFELKCFLSAPKRYIRDPWNYWDVAIQILSIVAVTNTNGNSLGSTSLRLNYLRAITVQVFGVRALTMLRVFRPTRYMITMVLEVFLDVLPFIPILVLIMLVWALIWSLLPTLASPPAPPSSFYSALITPINIIFGNAPSGDFSPVQLAVLVGSCVILALILMNFLIALISGTFGRIAGERALYDLRELFPLLRDFDAFARNLGLGREGNAYYLGLLPGQNEAEDLQGLAQSLANQVETSIQKSLSDLNQDIIKNSATLRDVIKREGQLAVDKIQVQADMYHQAAGHRSSDKGSQSYQSRIKKIEEMLKTLLATAVKP